MTLQQSPYATSGDYGPPGRTGWMGWVGFASIMLAMAGVFQGLNGLTALLNDDVYQVGDDGLVLSVNYTAWGWIHIGIAVILLVASGSLAAGHMFGRVIGVIAALLSATSNLAFISALPAWSAIVIAIDVLIIWAITVHGSELKTD